MTEEPGWRKVRKSRKVIYETTQCRQCGAGFPVKRLLCPIFCEDCQDEADAIGRVQERRTDALAAEMLREVMKELKGRGDRDKILDTIKRRLDLNGGRW